MSNLIVFLVGLFATGLVGGGMAITWLEFRKMDAAEPSQSALSGRTRPV